METYEYLMLLNRLKIIEHKLDKVLGMKSFDNEYYDEPIPEVYGCPPPTVDLPPAIEAEYLVVSMDNRIPKKIKGLNPTIIRKSDLIDKDFAIEKGIFCNLDSLDKDMYDLLKDERDILVIFYKIYDQYITLNFPMDLPIEIYYEGDL